MAYKLDQKLKDLEFERKQVLEHLTLLDVKITTVQKAIALMKAEEDIARYNTENFIYRQKRKLFKGKIRKYLVQILRNEFYQRDWITRTQISRKEVLWQWKLK